MGFAGWDLAGGAGWGRFGIFSVRLVGFWFRVGIRIVYEEGDLLFFSFLFLEFRVLLIFLGIFLVLKL